MRSSQLLALLLALTIGTAALALDPAHDAALGAQAFERGDYAAAIAAYRRATRATPDSAAYHHQLGRSFGRAAQHAKWLQALPLAEAAREALERAVALDPENAPATLDLMKFYAAAPGFLGGGTDKARALVARLDQLDPHAAARARDWLAERGYPAS